MGGHLLSKTEQNSSGTEREAGPGKNRDTMIFIQNDGGDAHRRATRDTSKGRGFATCGSFPSISSYEPWQGP